MENLPVLYRNCLDQYPTQFGKDVWLWAVERPGIGNMCYEADRFTEEVLYLVSRLLPMLNASSRIYGTELHNPRLLNFILTRHANWCFGGNVKPTYTLGAPAMKGDVT